MDRFISLIFVISLCLSACGRSATVDTETDAGTEIPLAYARYLSLHDCGDYIRADIRNPWDTTKTLHSYILLPESSELPATLPEGTIIRIPLKNALVYSTVHQSLVGELGANEAIGGICDRQYIHDDALLGRISSGDVTDCGSSYGPDMERIISLRPDAILLSPYEDSGNYGKLGRMGIPLIEGADYMETTPLGRMEWVKFYGLLFGRHAQADSLFAAIEHDYLSLKALTDTIGSHPKVLLDGIYGNSWYVPTAGSTMGTFIRDAGGTNPFDNAGNAASVGLSGERVLHEAGDADVWIVRYTQATDKTLRELAADNPIYRQFKPLKEGRVYGCNTDRIRYYEETPFHPHLLLRDLIGVIHPGLAGTDSVARYFTPLKP